MNFKAFFEMIDTPTSFLKKTTAFNASYWQKVIPDMNRQDLISFEVSCIQNLLKSINNYILKNNITPNALEKLAIDYLKKFIENPNFMNEKELEKNFEVFIRDMTAIPLTARVLLGFLRSNKDFSKGEITVARHLCNAFDWLIEIYNRIDGVFHPEDYLNLLRINFSQIVLPEDPILRDLIADIVTNDLSGVPILLDRLIENHPNEYEKFLRWLKTIGINTIDPYQIAKGLLKYKPDIINLFRKSLS